MARKPTKANIELLSTAYHEAAHAVAAKCCRIAVHSITIIPEGDSAGCVETHNLLFGTTDLDFDPSTKSRMRMERLVIQSLAGPIAEEIFNPEGFSHNNSESDYRTSITLVGYFCQSPEETDAYLELLRIRAKNLISQEYVWEQIEELANILFEKNELSKTKVNEFFRNKPINYL